MSDLKFLYSVERIYPYPPATLWAAWMQEQALSQWYSPVSLKVAEGSVVSEEKVGGIWTVGVDVPEYNFVAYFYGLYTRLEQDKLIEHTMNYTQNHAEFLARLASPEEHLIKIDFEANSNGTLVRFSQFGQLPEGEAEQAQAGMESYFDNLDRYLKANVG
ncbi:MAG: hypothetical protein RL523_650 [Actinomycetota bacterium]|jgi:uncharacterized protein YndB with AHSA1/START domain